MYWQPWDASLDYSLENPTFSGTVSAIVANELKSSGMNLYGWDLEWGPEDWGAGTRSLTSVPSHFYACIYLRASCTLF